MSLREPGANFEVLPWDSELFGFPVARVNSRDIQQSLVRMRQAGIRLAYCSVAHDDHQARSDMDAVGARLVDRKLRFRKMLEATVSSSTGVESFAGTQCTPELEALALASGHVSRFRVDPGIPDEVFRTLYLTWIRRSVSREIADEVLVIREGDSTTAMVTIARSGPAKETATIGLIAVAEGSRGRGHGTRLIAACESWCVDHDASVLEVVTQEQNLGACTLYRSCGYRVTMDEAVYHLWIER